MTLLKSITERVYRNGDPNDRSTPLCLLTIDEFFHGNDVVGSIGCNLDSTPSPSQFFELFKSISHRKDVHGVFVQITAFDTPDWPFSDTVWVITSCSEEEVQSWFPDELAPNEVWAGWIESQTYEPVDVPVGTTPIACWWD